MWGQEVTLWSEDFSSYSANDVPSGGTYSYVCTDGGSTTKIYNEKLAGRTAPELLVSKSNGTFTATVPLDNIEGDLTLTFYTNKQTISVNTETEGISGELSEKAEGQHTLTFTGVTASMTQIVIVFTGSGSSNVRLDDIVLKGSKANGGSQDGTYTVTYNANGATLGDVPTDENKYDSENNTVTVLGNTGNLAKEHYSFGGWNTKTDGTGTNYEAGETFTITANTTLYAKWNGNTHNVTLPAADTYGSYTMSATNPVAYGTEVTLTYTPATGYENCQATWSVNGTEIAGNTFTMPDEDVTVTVAVNEVLDYATLPFEFDGGRSDIANTIGLTQEGLDSDYSSATKLKFNGTGDWVVLKINEAPGKLTFDIKNNSFSGGTFTVQESADGENYTDLKKYTTIEGTQNEVLYPASTTRYIKWIYTEKSNGNVGLGNIKLAIPSTDPEIVADATVELDADATTGEIAYTINNAIDGTSLTASTTASWISDVTVAADKVTFTTTANEGAERTATITLAYGELTKDVTITQAAYVAPLTAVTDKMWTFEDWDDGDIATTTIIDNLEVNASSNKKISIDENKKSIDGYSFTKRLKLGGTGSTTERNVHFKVAGSSTITVYGMSGSSGNEREIQINIGDEVVESLVNDGTNIGKVEYNYSGEETDVYVYSKSSGNNIYGIKVEPYNDSAPAITVEDAGINVEAGESDGTIAVTYKNITDVVADVEFYEADGITKTTYDWIDAEINAENNVYYTVSANTGAERTAYLKVSALDDETNIVYSELISITQAKYVELGTSYYKKVTSTSDITSGQYLIVYEEGSVAFNGGLETLDATSNTISVTIDNNVIAASTETETAEFTVDVVTGTLKSASGQYIGVSSNSNGLKTSAEATDYTNAFSIDNAGNAVIDAKFDGSTMKLQYNADSNQKRFRYYKSEQKAIQLYKKVDTESESVYISSYKWATFSSDKAVDLTSLAGKAKAYIVTGAEGNTISTQEVSGAVKAGTGLLLYSETAGNYNIPVAEEGEDYSNSNKLIAVTENNTTITKATDGTTNYILTVQSEKVVFAYINSISATLNKGQAYLNLEGDAPAPFLGFDGTDTTGINLTTVNGQQTTDGVYYDLSGRRVVLPTKGMYIVNGRKVVIK